MAVPLATPIKAAALLKKQFPCALKIRWVAPSPLRRRVALYSHRLLLARTGSAGPTQDCRVAAWLGGLKSVEKLAISLRRVWSLCELQLAI